MMKIFTLNIEFGEFNKPFIERSCMGIIICFGFGVIVFSTYSLLGNLHYWKEISETIANEEEQEIIKEAIKNNVDIDVLLRRLRFTSEKYNGNA